MHFVPKDTRVSPTPLALSRHTPSNSSALLNSLPISVEGLSALNIGNKYIDRVRAGSSRSASERGPSCARRGASRRGAWRWRGNRRGTRGRAPRGIVGQPQLARGIRGRRIAHVFRLHREAGRSNRSTNPCDTNGSVKLLTCSVIPCPRVPTVAGPRSNATFERS